MASRPLRIAQTSKEAQKAYKKNGPRVPEREMKQLERLAELDTRAARFRDQEERKRAAKKKREEREKKEKDARKQLGVGLATQMVGYSHTQAKLKNGMEAYLGVKKQQADDKKRQEMEAQKVKEKMASIAENLDKEPWDDSDGDEAMADLPMTNGTIVLEGDHWIDDDLDDDSLLQVYDLLMSDPPNASMNVIPEPPPPSLPAHVLETEKPIVAKEDPNFMRLHGPINKAIEDTLNLLPDPLIELLSQDTSTDLARWNPDLALLHKLNPAGLPPHRLRLKMGCIVSLLREINTSSQISKSSLLRVIRIEQEWLECIVLDGPLQGTKSFITRVAFPARYRNEDQFAFKRMQFPVRVSTKHAHLSQPVSRNVPQSTFKIPSMPGQPSRPPSTFKKPAIPTPKPKPPSNSNPSFKLPGIPASRIINKPQLPDKPEVPALPALDSWDDFLESETQIARELSSDDSLSSPQPKPTPAVALDTAILFSTQDFDFSLDDLEDTTSNPPKVSPRVFPPKQNTLRQPPRTSSSNKQTNSNPLDKIIGTAARIISNPPKPSMAPPLPPPVPQSAKRKSPPTPAAEPAPKRVSLAKATLMPEKMTPIAKVVPLPGKATTVSKAVPALKTYNSFSDFGLSTQDAVSFFNDDDDDDDDDDDMAFGTPLVLV